MMKLINARPSPFGRKVAIAMLEKGIPFEIQWDIPWHADTAVPAFNPLEQLPILVTPAGETVYESSYILEWLEHHFPQPSLLPVRPSESRSTSSRVWLASHRNSVGAPLMVVLTWIFAMVAFFPLILRRR